MEQNQISLKGVETNNLKNLNVDFPLNSLTVVTGVSGSGKSSLVFDTLYGESYHRYLESLSSYARMYMANSLRPKVSKVKNLPAAIAVKQNRSTSNNRSTVATLTELGDLLQLIYTEYSKIYCKECAKEICNPSLKKLIAKLIKEFNGETITVLAPLREWQGYPESDLKSNLEIQGLVRVWEKGKVKKLEEVSKLDYLNQFIAIDRIKVAESAKTRLSEAIELSYKLGKGYAVFAKKDIVLKSANGLRCPDCYISFRKPQSALFSYNHPLGACTECQGFGKSSIVDWDKVFPDKDSCVQENGIRPLNFGSHVHYYKEIQALAKRNKIKLTKRFEDYSESDLKIIKFGDAQSNGMQGYFDWLDSKKYKAHYRIHAAKFRKYATCGSCSGRRYNVDINFYKIGDSTIVDAFDLSIEEFSDWLKQIDPGEGKAKEAVEESIQRCDYLEEVGVGYLKLNRLSGSLSGGEVQRIQMARCLGSALTETLYCLDEPTSGLHVRDTHKLLNVLFKLRDLGNTVVVVEHEQAVIDKADHLIEIGPNAGHKGGYIVHEKEADSDSMNQYFTLPSKEPFDVKKTDFLDLKGAATHNLKGIDVKIPMGKLTVVCGVSGSGKTSLIRHTLYPAILDHLGEGKGKFSEDSTYDSIGPNSVLGELKGIELVAQENIGRSSRSNIATYLGVYDAIRKLFAEQPQSLQLKLTPGHFSFNVAGGRCETCRGLGVVEEELSFLGNIPSVCSTCNGKRFSEDVLSVKFRNKNLIDVLSMTIEESLTLFYDKPKIRNVFNQVVELGLGYMVLGQNTSGFSGGEAQRLKLLKMFVGKDSSKGKHLLIFDEPSTGLSDRDVAQLCEHLHKLSEKGHTLVVVEHHLGMVKSADWVIEIGPEAAHRGGTAVYQGFPKGLKKLEKSPTGAYL